MKELIKNNKNSYYQSVIGCIYKPMREETR